MGRSKIQLEFSKLAVVWMRLAGLFMRLPLNALVEPRAQRSILSMDSLLHRCKQSLLCSVSLARNDGSEIPACGKCEVGEWTC